MVYRSTFTAAFADDDLTLIALPFIGSSPLSAARASGRDEESLKANSIIGSDEIGPRTLEQTDDGLANIVRYSFALAILPSKSYPRLSLEYGC